MSGSKATFVSFQSLVIVLGWPELPLPLRGSVCLVVAWRNGGSNSELGFARAPFSQLNYIPSCVRVLHSLLYRPVPRAIAKTVTPSGARRFRTDHFYYAIVMFTQLNLCPIHLDSIHDPVESVKLCLHLFNGFSLHITFVHVFANEECHNF